MSKFLLPNTLTRERQSLKKIEMIGVRITYIHEHITYIGKRLLLYAMS